MNVLRARARVREINGVGGHRISSAGGPRISSAGDYQQRRRPRSAARETKISSAGDSINSARDQQRARPRTAAREADQQRVCSRRQDALEISARLPLGISVR